MHCKKEIEQYTYFMLVESEIENGTILFLLCNYRKNDRPKGLFPWHDRSHIVRFTKEEIEKYALKQLFL